MWYGDEFRAKHPLPKHSTEDALAFLRRFAPGLTWVLTSIVPDGGSTTASFLSGDQQSHLAGLWIEARQGKENIYFHVNPTLRPLASKAAKVDIARLAWIHVDVDPRVGEKLEDERVRILRILQSYPKKTTVLVDSGGGYQGFWRLHPSDALETEGKLARIQELERYNIQIEREFNADHCHNIDRIMRLPGTINLPNLRKRKIGRVPALAQVVEWSDACVYEISQFTPAAQVQASGLPDGTLGAGRPKVTVPGNVPDIGVDELKEWASKSNTTISDHCFALIATGQDPVDPSKYPSRSEALFKVCCDLVRAGVPDEMIFAVITGPNEIASSVREKPDRDRYALRQIERAKDEVIDPILRQFNEKFAVIGDMGGKCRIISEVIDPALRRTRISKTSFEDFRNRYRHIRVQVGMSPDGQPITKQAGSFWIDHPQRRQYDTIVFAPGQEIDDAYNLWRGFGCDSLPGNKHESFLLHVRDNICDGNAEYYSYLVNWMARTVQHPDSPGEVAVVMRGKRGTGKGVFAKAFGALWGRHFIQVSNSKHLVGNFNMHLRDAVVVFGDEAFFAGDRQHESVLKTLITEEVLVIEGKGIDVEIAPNYTHLVLASNESWVVPAGLDERRFFVLEVGDEHKQDHSYFQAIKEDLDDGGLENLLYFLMTKDISAFNVRKVPQTTALLEQKILSMTAETEWVYEMLWEGRVLKSDIGWRNKIPVETLYEEYIRRMDQQRRPYRLNPTAFGRFLCGVLPKKSFKKVRELYNVPTINPDNGYQVMVERRGHLYCLPPLGECRAWWDAHQGGPYEWPADTEQVETGAVAGGKKGAPF